MTNQDRIWDILIEDAVREGGVSQEPQPVGKETRRLLTPVGAPGIDRGRSLREPSRRKWLPASVSVALLLMAAAILYAGVVYLPQLAETREPADQPKQAEGTNQSPVPQPRDNAPQAPDQTPEPQPQPDNPPTDSGEPQPDDSGTPEPDVTPDQPKPEPKPDDTVEQPKPDDTVEQPKPEPDDTVEQPKEPEGTDPDVRETVPVIRGKAILLIRAETGADLQIANAEYADTGKPAYRDPDDETAFANATWFKSRKPVDLVAGGVHVRLDGELRLEIYRPGGQVLIEPAKGTFFIDSRGSVLGTYVHMEQQDETLVIDGGAGMSLYDVSSSSVEVSVFDGELSIGDEKLHAGKRATVRKGELGSVKELRTSMEQEPFLEGLTNRVVYREDFNDAAPEGRLREGKLADGTVSGPTVFWGYPENIAYEAGLVIRLRVRTKGVRAFTLSQFCLERNDNYSTEVVLPDHVYDLESPTSVWHVLVISVDDLLERTNHKEHPQSGETFMNISLKVSGDDAHVELDWVELIRAVK